MSKSPADQERRRSILETFVFAGGALLSFALSLVRTKLQAVAWGASGVGAIGLMQAAMSTGTLVGGAGVDGYLTRELAVAGSDPQRQLELVTVARRGMVLLALIVAAVGFLVALAWRSKLGIDGAFDAAILAAATGVGILAANQRAVLAGTRRVRPLAVGQIAAAFAATVLTVVVVVSSSGPVAWAIAVALIPLSQAVAFAIGGRDSGPLGSWRDSARWAWAAARRSGVLAVAGMLPVATQLVIRMQANEHLSREALGAFQASLALAATSISVFASSIGPSVMPRLSAASSDSTHFRRLVSATIEEYQFLYAPVAIAMVALPELVTQVLFARGFEAVADQLRWQMVGEIFRLPCWVLATALTAQGRYRAYFVVELSSLIVTVAATGLSVETGSPAIIGAALASATIVQFAVLLMMVDRSLGAWSHRFVLLHLATAFLVAMLAWTASLSVIARIVGVVVALSWAMFSARRLAGVLSGRLDRGG